MARSGLTAVCSLLLLFAFVTAPAGAPKAGAGKAGAGSRQKVTDTDVTNVEREAMKCRAAADALDVYREFLAGVELTPRQKQVVEDRQKAWQDRIDRKLVKLGVEWVTIDAAKETGKRANALIDEAFQKIKEKDFKKAASLFERAVKQDPSGVRADYYLGMLNTPNFWNYAVSAEKNFERAHRRDPDNAAIANNLAISKVKMGKFPEAIDLWSQALRNAPEAPEVVHNLGRFAAAANNGRLAGAKTTAKRASTIFDKAVADKKGPGYDLKQGWLYTPVPLPPEERERAGAPAAADDQNPADDGQENNAKPGIPKAADAKPEASKRPRVLVGSGTGFVIQPGYILSNRHVAQAGSSFGILLPSDPKVEHTASVVAVAGDLDLALFRCEPLAAPAVKLNGESPRRGSEIMVLGYPFSDVLGNSLKAIRGNIFGFEDDAKKQTVMYEATTNPGNSGGPVCDNTGRVVAVHFAGANLAILNRGSGKFGLGVPIECALPFIQKSLPDLAPETAGEKLEWPDIDESVGKSVVLVKLYADTLVFAPASTGEKKLANIFEDRTCVGCKGRSKLPCRNCFKGSITVFESSYSINGVGPGAQVLKWDTPRPKSCPGCRGAGVIDCPHCQNGSDPSLK
jgi:S1-C subfamily serine protease